MTVSYRNAARVLPRKLLEQVQEYASGEVLYIPTAHSRVTRRKVLVLMLRAQGLTMREIASRVRISERRVRQILAAHRRQETLAILPPANTSDQMTEQPSDRC